MNQSLTPMRVLKTRLELDLEFPCGERQYEKIQQVWEWLEDQAGVIDYSWEQRARLIMGFPNWENLPPSDAYWRTLYNYFRQRGRGEPVQGGLNAWVSFRGVMTRYFTKEFQEVPNDAQWDTDDDE